MNQVDVGAIFAGLRTYFRYAPIFLLPIVFPVSDAEIRVQLKFLLLLILLQIPLVIYQRFVQFAGVGSGDPISGTLTLSGTLSIVLISAIAVLIGFYLKKRLNIGLLIFLVLALFIPTTLNETKVTIILLPIAITVPAVLFSIKEKRVIELISVVIVAVLLLGAFVNIYDKSPGGGRGKTFGEFVQEGKLNTYLYHQEGADAQTGDFELPGRVDSILWAIEKLSGDVTKLAFGLGIGNVSRSFSEKFYGTYTEKYAYLAPQLTAFSNLLWEVGLIGTFLVLIGCYFVFSDARQLSGVNSIAGALSLGWITVAIIYVICLGYQNLITTSVIGFLFAYLSGYIAASRQRLGVIVKSPAQ
ncbi:MAG: hypothetical protein ACC707_14685 [Thiohalomonadales bacterium]